MSWKRCLMPRLSVCTQLCAFVYVFSRRLRAAQLGCRQQLEAGGGSNYRTDDVTSRTRAGITRSHDSCLKVSPTSTSQETQAASILRHSRGLDLEIHPAV